MESDLTAIYDVTIVTKEDGVTYTESFYDLENALEYLKTRIQDGFIVVNDIESITIKSDLV